MKATRTLYGRSKGRVFGVNAEQRDLRALLAGERLPVLDGLRAVSVFVVMLSHSGLGAFPGDLGVSAFFVLSGFLITWLLIRERAVTGEISLRRFYLRRTLRIFPAYYVFLVLSYVVDTLRGASWSAGLSAAAVFYALNYYNAVLGHPHTSIAHAWSLAVEEQFYLMWPLAFAVLARRGPRMTIRTLLVVVAAIVIWRSCLYIGLGASTAYVYNAFDTRFDNLAIGCLLALVAGQSRFVALARVLSASPLLPLLTIAALFASRVLAPEAWHYGPGFTVDAVLIALLIVQLLHVSVSPLWSWLDLPLVRWLGTISYPIYLYHAWGLGLGRWATLLPEAGRFGLGIGITIALAAGSYYLIERPFLRVKERFQSAGART